MATPLSAAPRYMEAYSAVRERLADLVRARGCETPVPACPGWRVRDVIAHLTGLCEDWADGRLDGYASDSWTADQVSRSAGRTCERIVQSWAEAMVPFAGVDDVLLGSPPARWAFGDAVVHEADVRGALAAGRVPEDTVLFGLHDTMGRWQREILGPAHLPALHVRPPDARRDWWLGTAEDPTAVVVTVPVYDLFRALAGRRSADQVREWEWSADPEPFIDAGLPYPFHWASAPLSD